MSYGVWPLGVKFDDAQTVAALPDVAKQAEQAKDWFATHGYATEFIAAFVTPAGKVVAFRAPTVEAYQKAVEAQQ